jgi:uncharacterized membrane protein
MQGWERFTIISLETHHFCHDFRESPLQPSDFRRHGHPMVRTSPPRGKTMKAPTHVQEHIDTIAKHEQDFLERRSAAERMGDLTAAIVGNLAFVAIHLVLFVLWILVNTMNILHIRHFDPVPFSLLGTIVAIEAILLVSLILMRQARLARRADERDHLMLQILLLTEKEVTALIGMNQQIAIKTGVRDVENSQEIEQLGSDTSIDGVAEDIRQRLSEDQ